MNVPEDEQIDLLLKDVSEVCTGYGNENMEMLEITVPDAESKGIGRLCGGVATQTSSDDESDLDPLSCRDNCDEDPNWENCSIYNLKIFDSMGTMNPMYFFSQWN
ncbi:hypothetical protein CDAR_549241 [Caerostris darwini]|uniref:Uncharacterized protein n=1 Tax=Caerostris darwini TaxID=1538125 RepID=A0AAV4X8B1_9ARAC|nr:hypothetical protein CDAR_549241 [Caerostris darwini]